MKTLNMFYLVIYWTQKYTMASFFYVVSHCHLSATLQTTSIIGETYKTNGLRFEFLSHF
jgi:hypothetical protein